MNVGGNTSQHSRIRFSTVWARRLLTHFVHTAKCSSSTTIFNILCFLTQYRISIKVWSISYQPCSKLSQNSRVDANRYAIDAEQCSYSHAIQFYNPLQTQSQNPYPSIIRTTLSPLSPLSLSPPRRPIPQPSPRTIQPTPLRLKRSNTPL